MEAMKVNSGWNKRENKGERAGARKLEMREGEQMDGNRRDDCWGTGGLALGT